MSTWEFIADISRKSYFLIPLMALLLVFTLAVILERLYFFTRVLSAGRAMEHDVQLVKYQNTSDLQLVTKHYENTVQVSILETALTSSGESADEMERRIDETIMWQLPKMDRFLWLIDTSVTLGPLMGLLGTIFGMIESFNLLGANATSNPSGVTNGISHALIATALGLSIAIVAVSFLNFFHKRLRLALHQMDLLKVMTINRFHGDETTRGTSPELVYKKAGAK
ncbi:MAG: MotA/TolQ/ExbB proton channel family protein [Pseudomonadota bacterium]